MRRSLPSNPLPQPPPAALFQRRGSPIAPPTPPHSRPRPRPRTPPRTRPRAVAPQPPHHPPPPPAPPLTSGWYRAGSADPTHPAACAAPTARCGLDYGSGWFASAALRLLRAAWTAAPLRPLGSRPCWGGGGGPRSHPPRCGIREGSRLPAQHTRSQSSPGRVGAAASRPRAPPPCWPRPLPAPPSAATESSGRRGMSDGDLGA